MKLISYATATIVVLIHGLGSPLCMERADWQ